MSTNAPDPRMEEGAANPGAGEAAPGPQRTFMDAELFMTEKEIRDKGYAIDLPYEAGEAQPKKIIYADTDDEQRQVPEHLLKDWDLNFDDEIEEVPDEEGSMDMAEVVVKPHYRDGKLVKGYRYRRKGGKKGLLNSLWRWRSAKECSDILASGGDSRSGVTYPVDAPEGKKSVKFIPEREELHREIVDGFLAKARPVQDGPGEVIFTAGGPASGKSSLTKRGVLEKIGSRPLPDDYVPVDADLVKRQIPEYGTMLDAGDDRAAFFVHNESSLIASRLRFEALESNRNILVDQVGNNADGEFAKKIRQSRGPNTDVRVIYADVPVEEAIRRSDKRAEETGRKVPHDLIRDKHKGVVRNFLEVAQMDGVSIELYDTDGPEDVPPTLIAAKDADGVLQIINRDLFDRFMRKGGVSWPK